MKQEVIEDYLKTIYDLAETDSPVSTSRLAQAQEAKPAYVTTTMQRLAELGLVHYKKSHGVTLTSAGNKIALETLRHHRLIELYLNQILGFGWDEVHDQAELLEHVISEQLEERIADVLGHPTFDPHGDPIPSKDGKIVARYSEPLSKLKEGRSAVVLRVTESRDSELLSYLAQLGIIPGAEISIVEVAPFDGPVTLQIDGSQKIIGHNIANIVEVQPQTPQERLT